MVRFGAWSQPAWRLAAWLAAVVVAFGGAAGALAFDKVYMKDGKVQQGNVDGMTKDSVRLSVSSIPQEIKVNEIREIAYADETSDLALVRSRIRGGQLEDALEKLNTIDVASLPSDYIKADVEYYKAYCNAQLAMVGGGDKATAKALLGAFIGRNRDSYHWYDASEVFGDLSVSMGDYATAAKAYGAVAQSPFPDYKLRATVLEARALQAQGQHQPALAKFEEVANIAASNNPLVEEQKTLAQIGKASSLAATGRALDGIKIIEGIIEKNDPRDVKLFARAYTALGACYMADKANKESRKGALMAYLYVDLLFPQDAESHAEALHHLSTLWTAENHPERARAAQDTLRDRYPGSRWVQR